MKHLIKHLLGRRGNQTPKPEAAQAVDKAYPDLPPVEVAYLREFDAFTMTSIERRYALLQSIQYILKHGLPGAWVECGVWKGGNAMLMMRELIRQGQERDIHLYDTFCGMPEPQEADEDFCGTKAAVRLKNDHALRDTSDVWAHASLDSVSANLQSTGYPSKRITLVEGRVEDTLPDRAPAQISLLRLDTDWYSSTLHELRCLYPRLVQGGILLIDDYGYWKGARKAVDEYFSSLPRAPLLMRIDNTGRLAVKP